MPYADPIKQREYWAAYQRKHQQKYREQKRKRLAAWREANREYCRANHKTWKRSNPEKIYAGNALRRAIYSGKIHRQPCEICGAVNTHARHADYSKPLEVNWLCPSHHYYANRKLHPEPKAP